MAAEKRSLIPAPQGGVPIRSLEEVCSLGETLAKSGYFSDARQAAQAVVKILAGAELGFSPIAAMTGIAIIGGKPEVGARLLSAMIRRSPDYDLDIEQCSRQICELVFWERSLPKGGETRKRTEGWVRKRESIRLTIEEATASGWTQGKPAWKAAPDDMLFARCIGKGFRRYCSDLAGGVSVYAAGELDDQPAELPPHARQLPSAQLPEQKPPLPLSAPQTDVPDGRISGAMESQLKSLLRQEGAPTEADFLVRYQIERVGFLPVEHYRDAAQWIRDCIEGPAKPPVPEQAVPEPTITREQFGAIAAELERAPAFATALLETMGYERWGQLPQRLYPLAAWIARQPNFDLAGFRQKDLLGGTMAQQTPQTAEFITKALTQKEGT